jgi:hypothetical protein
MANAALQFFLTRTFFDLDAVDGKLQSVEWLSISMLLML